MKLKDLRNNEKTVDVALGEDVVQVKQYLPTQDKMSILKAIRTNCFDEQIVDQAKMDALFNALIIKEYTNIEFIHDTAEEILEFYDLLESNNYMRPIINAIPQIEYDALVGYLENTISDYNKYKTSAIAAFAYIAEYGPALMEKISEISKEIDVEAIKLVSDIASKMD